MTQDERCRGGGANVQGAVEGGAFTCDQGGGKAPQEMEGGGQGRGSNRVA